MIQKYHFKGIVHLKIYQTCINFLLQWTKNEKFCIIVAAISHILRVIGVRDHQGLRMTSKDHKCEWNGLYDYILKRLKTRLFKSENLLIVFRPSIFFSFMDSHTPSGMTVEIGVKLTNNSSRIFSNALHFGFSFMQSYQIAFGKFGIYSAQISLSLCRKKQCQCSAK